MQWIKELPLYRKQEVYMKTVIKVGGGNRIFTCMQIYVTRSWQYSKTCNKEPKKQTTFVQWTNHLLPMILLQNCGSRARNHSKWTVKISYIHALKI